MSADAEPLRDISVLALAISQDGSLFATGSKDGQIQLWRAADGTLVRAMPRQDFLIGSLTFAKGSRLIASRLSLRRQAPLHRLEHRQRREAARLCRP